MRNQIVNPCCDIAAPMLEKEDDEVKNEFDYIFFVMAVIMNRCYKISIFNLFD